MAEALLVDAEAVERAVRRMAVTLVEAARRSGAASPSELALVGIRRGGVPVARRLAAALAEAEGASVPVGTVDIALYRDDAATALPDPKIGPSSLPFGPRGRHVVLVDDVLQTGRTVRAAIDCLLDYGRPRRVWLAVLFDRGGRELPIAADVVGREVEVPPGAELALVLDEHGAPAGARLEERP